MVRSYGAIDVGEAAAGGGGGGGGGGAPLPLSPRAPMCSVEPSTPRLCEGDGATSTSTSAAASSSSRAAARLRVAVAAVAFVAVASTARGAGRGWWGRSRDPPTTLLKRTAEGDNGDNDGRAPPAAAYGVLPYHDEDEELFYDEQLVDHFGGSTSTWSNRYFKGTNYWRGPGHPIFMVVGGEGAITKMLYPFVTEHLAKHFGAAVIQIEHRFYGPYQPIMGRDATVSELIDLLTPEQAMADMVRLTKRFKEELGCAGYSRGDRYYCPVISVGGSYPGFLSAMFRVAYPDFYDASYASSAPLRLYDQSADQNVYYDIVTEAAERASPGCAGSVRAALENAKGRMESANSVAEAAAGAGMCLDTLPEYLTTTEIFARDTMMAVGFTFADFDMGAYPPGEDTGLYKACRVFQSDDASSLEKVANFFSLLVDGEEGSESDEEGGRPCFDLSVFLPDGDNPRIQTSDWSGSGGGNDGHMWDFQLCTRLVDPIGFSEESMFPSRVWTYEDLTAYCQLRYGKEVVPRPYALVGEWGFDDLVRNGASKILFTNGMQDMWSGGSYLEDLSDTILALNFENGAHHSDLSHVGPSENDTEDIRAGFIKITNILEKWLAEI